ncbi:Vacuolar cation/proton exchanger 1 [Xylographa carneopallida]|nr:Vacuolar cation/proton exchanger 1 [Xylographa carneopallida]
MSFTRVPKDGESLAGSAAPTQYETTSDTPYSSAHEYESKYSGSVSKPGKAKRGFAADDDDILASTVVEESEPEVEKHADTKADEWPSVLADGWRAYWLRTLHDIFLTSWMNLLLLCIPVAIIVDLAHAPPAAVFVFSLLSLCPLAERIAFVTDEMAKYTNDTFGGLMSATMGNVTELIVSIVAIIKGGSLLIVTQLSLVGSVVSNILLVLGMSFLVGGYKHTNQRYSKPAANANIGLLLLSTMAIILPTLMTITRPINYWSFNLYPSYFNIHDPNLPDNATLNFSRTISVMMLVLYGLLVYYQLFTHRTLFETQEDEEEDEAPPVLGLWGAVGWAAIITVLIAILSEFIVGSIESFAEQSGIPIMFVSTIFLPIVGNAAEHASAIIFAYRNQMDISLSIAVGSATQISLFVIPFCVVVAAMAGEALSLDFGTFQVAVMFMSILITVVAIQTGTSDWLKGALLIATYFILCAAYWVIHAPIALESPVAPDLRDPLTYLPPAPSSTGRGF